MSALGWAVLAAGWAVAGLATSGAALLWLRERRRALRVARAAHELRAPLTAMGLQLCAQRRTGAGAAVIAELLAGELDRARLALADLAAAIDGRDAVPSAAAGVHLEALVRRTVAARSAASGRAIELDWRAGPVVVRGDRRRLGQALANLLDNAARHGGGGVTVRGTAEAGRVRIEVRDRGPGLAAPLGTLAGRPRGQHGHGLAVAAAACAEIGGRLCSAPARDGARLVMELPVSSARSAGPVAA